jgi:hypothetical protein
VPIVAVDLRVFLVESYISNDECHHLDTLRDRLHAAIAERQGDARILAVIQLPEENTLLSIVEADTASVAAALASSIGAPGDRIVNAIAFIASATE